MIKLLQGCVKHFVSFVLAAFAPLIALRRADDRWASYRIWGIHALAVVLGIIGLGYLQAHFEIDSFVRTSLPLLRSLWLPLVGVLLYGIAWSAWLVARTLRVPAEQAPCGIITAAWQEGLDRLSRAGIDVQQTPLFLILGAPAGGIRDFFTASRTDLMVLPAAEESGNVIQVFGNHEGIYVCCREASLLNDFSRRAAANRLARQQAAQQYQARCLREPAHKWSSPAAQTAGLARRQGEGTAAFTPASQAAAAIANPAPAAVGTDGNVASSGSVGTAEPATGTFPAGPTASATTSSPEPSAAERLDQTIDELEALAGSPEPTGSDSQVLQPRPPKDPLTQLEHLHATELLERLDTLCREIAATRQPYCPINGIVVMIPLDAADRSDAADHVGMCMERDLETIAAASESSVSAQVVLTDLETCDGGQAFLDRFPDAQRQRRLGTALPATPASEPQAGPDGIDQAVRWICHDLIPPLSYRLMDRALDNPLTDRSHCTENHLIHRLIDSTRHRCDAISRMLRRGATACLGRVRLRGCYLAATGGKGLKQQGFCEGVVPVILNLQNEVQWSPQRRSRDRWQRRAAGATYAVIAVATACTLFLLFNWHFHN